MDGDQAGRPAEGSTDTDQLRAEIDQTRNDLGETVEALAAKADVKARAQEKATELKDRAAQKGQDMRGGVADMTGRTREAVTSEEAAPARRSGAGIAALAAAGLAVWMWRRRARRTATPAARTSTKAVAVSKLAGAQLKTLRGEVQAGAKTGAKAARKRADAQAKAARKRVGHKAKDMRGSKLHRVKSKIRSS